MARSSITAKQLIYDARGLLGNRDSIHPIDQEAIRFLNYSLFTLSNLLDGLYRSQETASAAIGRSTKNAIAMSYTATFSPTTKIVTFGGAHGMTSVHQGSLLVMINTSDNKAYAGVIETIPSATTVLMTTTMGAASGVTTSSVFVHPYPWYFDGINFGTSNVKHVLGVHDSTTGDCIRMNHNELEDFDQNLNLAASIGAWIFGDGVFLRKGSSVSAWGGTTTLYYRSDPTEVTALTDSVDIEMEHHQALVQDVARQIEKSHPTVGQRQSQDDPFGYLRQLYDAVEMSFVTKKLGLDVPNKVN